MGRTAGHLDGVRLAGEPASQFPDLDPRTAPSFGADDNTQEREFRFAAGAFAPQGAGAATGSVVVELDDRDPRKVWVVIVCRERFFAPEVSALMARAGGIADPAGNLIGDRRADAATATGTL